MRTDHDDPVRSASGIRRGSTSWARWDETRDASPTPLSDRDGTKPRVPPQTSARPGAIDLATHCSRVRKVSAREPVFYKGDPASHLYVVVTGLVKVSAPSDEGKEITFAILGPGELFGEIGVLEETEHSATVTALEPSELGVFSRQDFQRLLTSQPSFAVTLLAILYERLRKASEMAEDIFFLSLPARLAKKLLELTEAHGQPHAEGLRIGVHLCQQELANLIGTSRESVNKQLAAWHASGIVKQDRGHLVVRKLEALASMAKLTPFPAPGRAAR